MYKYATIGDDPSVDELKAEIIRLKDLSTSHRNDDQASKVLLNSVYGVLGSPVFIGYHRDVAESVTKQSQHIIQYMEKCFNKYFNDYWHKDTELHQILGVGPQTQYTAPVVNYLDTDSVFVVLEPIYQQSKYPGSFTDFALALQKHRLKDFIDKCLLAYTKNHNSFDTRRDGSPSFVLVMEQICESILWTGKKKYAKNTIWKKGAAFESLSKIEIKGLEANQSSTPKYVRNKLKELIKFIFESKGKIKQDVLISKLMAIRKEMEVIGIDEVCKTERISNYQDYIINDTTAIEIGKNCKPHTKGAAHYNYLLYNNEKLKNKYQFIQTGEKVRYMHIMNQTGIDIFAFPPGAYPYEMQIKPDYDAQFEKLVLGPLNNILVALKFKSLDKELMIFPSLF